MLLLSIWNEDAGIKTQTKKMLKLDAFYLTLETKIQELKQTKKALKTRAQKLWHISISSGVSMEMHSAVGMATFITKIMGIYNVTVLS